MTDKYDVERCREEAVEGAQRLMTIMESEFKYPGQALVAGMITCATLAHGIDMPIEVLLEGIRAAYSDLVRAEKEGGRNAH